MTDKPGKKRMKRPFVLINMAMTVDGKIATTNRAIHAFSSRRDLNHLYELRATADAVMCGARTVEISRSILDNGGKRFGRLRLKNGLAEHPLRFIVSGSGSINPEARIFQTHFAPIIVLTTARISRSKRIELEKLGAIVKTFGRTKLNFPAALEWLRIEWKVRRLLCEGGGEVNAAMVTDDLVDELHLTICPKVFGGRTAPTIADGIGFSALSQARLFKLKSMHQYGSELFTVFSRQKRS